MKKSLKIFLICLAVVEVLQLGIQLTAIIGFKILTTDLSSPLPKNKDVETCTFSLPNVEYEAELEEEDTKNIRSFLSEFALIMPTPYPCNIYGGNGPRTLTIQYTGGEEHSIVFKSEDEILGIPLGIIEYDGRDYYVDYWMYLYGEKLCEPFVQEYKNN